MSNELIKTVDIKPSEVFVPNGLDQILGEIKKEVSSFVPDVSTESKRKEISSLCYKIKRSKTYLDGIGKDYVTDLKKQPKIVDGERKRMREYLDSLEEDIRRPLTEWEEKEEKRVGDILQRINGIDPFQGGITSIAVGDRSINDLYGLLDKANKFVVDDSLEEHKESASKRRDDVVLKLTGLIATQEKQEAEQAELERLRQEAAAREQRDREERIAKESAERARLQAEAEAKDREQKAEREKSAAVQAQKDAELRAKQAEENAKLDAERAAQAERVKIEQEAQKASEEAAKREANKKHNAKINNQAVAALKTIGLTDEMSKAVVVAIAKKQIPNVSISY